MRWRTAPRPTSGESGRGWIGAARRPLLRRRRPIRPRRTATASCWLRTRLDGSVDGALRKGEADVRGEWPQFWSKGHGHLEFQRTVKQHRLKVKYTCLYVVITCLIRRQPALGKCGSVAALGVPCGADGAGDFRRSASRSARPLPQGRFVTRRSRHHRGQCRDDQRIRARGRDRRPIKHHPQMMVVHEDLEHSSFRRDRKSVV